MSRKSYEMVLTNSVGDVIGKLSTAAGTLTRPANTTAYAVNDTVTDSGTAGISVSIAPSNDTPMDLARLVITTADTGPGAASAQFEAYIYNAAVTTSADNAAFTVTQAGFCGLMTGTFKAASDGSFCELTPVQGALLGAAPVSGAKTFFIALKTLTIFTPSANSTVLTLTLKGYPLNA